MSSQSTFVLRRMKNVLTDYLLVSGSLFVLTLTIGQLLVTRKQSANYILFSLFAVSFLWISHGISYRFGLIDRLPHLNKVYLPLLCLTGPLWFEYVRSLHNTAKPVPFPRFNFMAPAFCIFLSLPFYFQSVTYKRAYIEIDLADKPSILMYGASRLAEFSLIWYFTKSILFLHQVTVYEKLKDKISSSTVLYAMSVIALIAAAIRLIGSINGDHTVSVLYPCLVALAIFIAMYLVSYRRPVMLGLNNSSRIVQTKPGDIQELERVNRLIDSKKWYLNPDIKIQTVARRTNIPTAELSSLINTVAGMNFSEYINTFRIEHAKQLLLEDLHKTALNVALESGYNSKSAFYKHFKSTTLLSPIAFREANKIIESSDASKTVLP